MEGSSSGIKWDVCVDGSDISLDAFKIVFDELWRDGDFMIVSHVFSNDKDYLSIRYKPDNLKQHYETHLIGTHSSKWIMVWEHLQKGLTTKEHLNKIAKDNEADFIVMGYHGRKGEKEDPTLLGSAVEYMAHHPVCTALVVKSPEKRKEKADGGFRWLVCSDGSEKSYKALRETIRLMDKEVDHLIVLVVNLSSLNTQDIELKTSEICEEENVKDHKFETIDRDSDEKTYESIVDYINVDDTDYIDFVTVANQGSGYKMHLEPKYLGSVAKGVLCNAKCNVVLVF